MDESLYNPDELTAPKWMNEEFFQLALSTHEKDESIEVTNLDISPASMKGDHYGSIMFRVKVQYKSAKDEHRKHKSVIVKTLPDEGGKRELLDQSSMFETEINMYTQALPKIEAILAAHGDNTKFAPKIIYHSLKPNKVLVLEDLCESGYAILRDGWPSEKDAIKIYQKLGKLHAVSHALGQSEEHEIVTSYCHGNLNNTFMVEGDLFSNGPRRFIEMLSAHEEFNVYVEKLRAIEGEILEKARQMYLAYRQGVKDEVYVLNHGDYHMKNLMFKFNDNEEMEDFRMVDFQLSVYAPAVADLGYSHTMMLNSELRAKFATLERAYFDQFIATLKLIKFEGKMPTYAGLKMAQLRYRHYYLFMISTFLPLVSLLLLQKPEDMKDVNTEEMFTDPAGFAVIYKNPEIIKEARILLPKLLEAGYMD